jgi:hypothetical protein
MLKKIIQLSLLFLVINFFALYAGICGKADIGATYIDLDILKSGHTEETLHMKGFKGDATVQVYGGFVLKPGFIWAKGKGELASGSIGIGHCFPIFKNFTLIPSAGVTFSYVRTDIDLEIPGLGILEDQKERFRSTSPYAALEFSYTFLENWTLIGCYQYAWSRTHTKIGKVVSEKSNCCGPNYSLGLEYSINKNWAVNFGAGYNISLSKEKHGIRGKGLKLGVAYYF